MIDKKARFLIQLGTVLWVSFMSAGVAAMLFFATFDPPKIAEVATFPMELSRSGGYTIGFLLFWVMLIFNSAAVLWLAGRDPNKTN